MAAVVTAAVVYGVWRQLDLELQLGVWSDPLRGAAVFGGLTWTWSATRPKPQAAVAPAADLRPCPYCAEPIQAAARVCRYCSRNVDPVPRQLSFLRQPAQLQTATRASGARHPP